MAASEAPIKSLEVQVEAQANSAIAALDKLADHLDKVAQKLASMSGDLKALGNISSAIRKIEKVTEKSAKATKEVNSKKVAPKVDTSQAEKLNKVMDEVRKKMTLADAAEVKPKFSGMNEQMFKSVRDYVADVTKAKQLPAVSQKNPIAEIEEQAKAAARVSAATKQATDSVKKLEEESNRGVFGTKLKRSDGGLTRAGMEAKKSSGDFKSAADAMGDLRRKTSETEQAIAKRNKLIEEYTERVREYAKENNLPAIEAMAKGIASVAAGMRLAKRAIDDTGNLKDKETKRDIAAEARDAVIAARSLNKEISSVPIEKNGWTRFLEDLREVAPALKKIMSVMGKAAKSVASGAAKMAKAIIHPLKSVKQLGSSLRSLLGIEKRSGGLLRGRSLGQFIGLIAFRRAITAAIRALTSGIKEGSDNLTHYSAEYNNSISSMVSSLNYLKNAWAAAFAPIVNVVAPYISAFIDMLASALNAIGRFMAVLTGKGFAVQAVKGWTDVAAAANSAAGGAGKAAKAAEEYKRTIMSFDELHVLNAPDDGSGSGGSGGGGGGGNGTDYSSMFTTVAVDTEEGLAAALRKAFDAGDFEEIGNLLAEAIADSLDKLNWEDIEAKASGVASKLASTINGFIGNDHLWSSLGETIGGMINTASSTVATFFDEVKFQKLGEQVGTAVNKAVGKWKPSKTGKAIAGIINSGISSSYGFLSTTDFSSLGTKVGQMTIDAVNGIKWETLGSSVALFGIGLFNFINSYLKTPGLFTSLGTNIKNGIKSWFNTMNTQKGWESIGATVRLALTALVDFVGGRLPDADEWDEFEKGITDAIEQVFNGLAGDNGEINTLAEKFGTVIEKIIIAAFKMPVTKIKIQQAIIKGFLESIEDTAVGKLLGVDDVLKGMEAASDLVGNANGTTADQGAGNTFDATIKVKGIVDSSVETAKKAYDSIPKGVTTATKKAYGATDTTSWNKLKGKWEQVGNKKITDIYKKLHGALDTASWNKMTKEYNKYGSRKVVVDLQGNVVVLNKTLTGFTLQADKIISKGGATMELKAEGGFVDAGQVFVAREAGPELVGRVGSRTAVANNDQIISGIEGGVYRAMVAAVGGGNSNSMPYQINVTVKTQNDEVLARAVQRGNASRNYRANAFA